MAAFLSSSYLHSFTPLFIVAFGSMFPSARAQLPLLNPTILILGQAWTNVNCSMVPMVGAQADLNCGVGLTNQTLVSVHSDAEGFFIMGLTASYQSRDFNKSTCKVNVTSSDGVATQQLSLHQSAWIDGTPVDFGNVYMAVPNPPWAQ